jgi:hypothetical protein
MKKGTRAVTNVNLLRWCAYYDLKVLWNLIWGFPGETVETVAEQAALLPSLYHLAPPGHACGISIDRYGPLFEDAVSYPRSSMRPAARYEAVYPPAVDLERAAYSFEADFDGTLPFEAFAPLVDAVRAWDRAARDRPRPTLVAKRAPGIVHVDDRRVRHEWRVHELRDEVAEVYLACFDEPRSARTISEKLDAPIGAEATEAILAGLREERLVVKDGNLYLALALPATPHR